MGKSSIVMVAIVFVSAIAMYKAPWWGCLIILILLLLAFLYWFRNILSFSRDHPAESLLEGATYASYKQIEAETKSGRAIETENVVPELDRPIELPMIPSQILEEDK